ncbi:MAG: TolC family protein, partial [Candidatus Latescibacterota bacterium]
MTDRSGGVVSFFLVFAVLCLVAAAGEETPVWSQTNQGNSVRDTLRLSLNDAIKLAMENNEDIRIAEAGLQRARGRKKEAFSAALPYIGLDAGYTRNILRPVIFFRDPISEEVLQIEIGEEHDYLMHISFSQVLFAFGRVGGAIKAADYFLKSSEATLEAANRSIKLETEIAYYEALLAAEVKEIAEQSLDAAQKHFDETKRKLRQQMASNFDSIRAEVQVKNREPEVIKADNAIRLTRLNLKRIIGVDRNTPVVLTDSLGFEPQTYSLEDAINEAYKMRADVRALRLNVSMAEKIYQVRKRSNFPMLEL